MTPPQQPHCCETCDNLEISDITDSCPNEEVCGKTGCHISAGVKSWIEIHGCASHSSRPATTPGLEQTVIEELLAIEGYINGIRSGDESPKRMCEHISASIGVIRSVIKEQESLRSSSPKECEQ